MTTETSTDTLAAARRLAGFAGELSSAAIARAAELANVSTDDVRCVKYERPPTVLGELLGTNAAAPIGRGIDLSAIVNLAAPRAYYLWTWLPTAMANSR